MGDNLDGDTVGTPTHTVTLSAFYMDMCEVTKAQWDGVFTWATNNGYSFTFAGSGKAANHPVQTINWYDCVKWCNARSQKEGLIPAYYTDAGLTVIYNSGQVTNPYVKWNTGYRLPTEAEWEYAARGGLNGKRFSWGDNITHPNANYYSEAGYSFDVSATRGSHPTYATNGTPYTSPVGSFAANGYGLYDMVGNVNEWCWDWSGSYSSGAQTDPRGPASGSGRLYRGGSWNDSAWDCRAASRNFNFPDFNYYFIGFRAVRPPGQ
jgi:formylglycine-generating enzyme required for sulfatase activity